MKENEKQVQSINQTENQMEGRKSLVEPKGWRDYRRSQRNGCPWPNQGDDWLRRSWKGWGSPAKLRDDLPWWSRGSVSQGVADGSTAWGGVQGSEAWGGATVRIETPGWSWWTGNPRWRHTAWWNQRRSSRRVKGASVDGAEELDGLGMESGSGEAGWHCKMWTIYIFFALFFYFNALFIYKCFVYFYITTFTSSLIYYNNI